ncbi:MAG: polyprenyl synthetase family protein [Geodermatophilaceae bacterium]|nr:polyprenyl synthetase family protein [Geodermatophilaceae bacterium]MDQ3476182.1 polyprenyl synthetase family protein [Actinomycetota bacterium]
MPGRAAAALGLSAIGGDLEPVLQRGLDAVEELLRASVASDFEFVGEASRHLVEAGGKRFRPLLTLLAAQLGDASAPGVVPAAVVVELTHLATLYHDDVMDEADVRRGAPSANSRWDNSVAILTGDFLFARASDLLADLGPEAVRIQARTFERLVTGQIRETVGPASDTDPVEHYLSVLTDKTGSLVATAARFGAMFAGVPDPIRTGLTSYGEAVGIAFQISDDLLDISSEQGISGKAPGTDLREGIATLPILLARAGRDPAESRLRALLSGPLTDTDSHAEALAGLRTSDAMVRARAMLVGYVDRAKLTLEPLPAGPVRDALASLCDVMLERTA